MLEPPDVLPPEVVVVVPPEVELIPPDVLPPVEVDVPPPEVEPPEVVPPEVDELPPEVEVDDFVDLVDLVDLVDFVKNDLLKVDFVVLVFEKNPEFVVLKKNAFASVGVTAATDVVATAALTTAALVSFRYCILVTP
ncbi:hypothetical protein EH31_02935 [Erythrobacter longus]|uniref:Uncharacterized protein n=1 Tax=Erythrobacter longus TaxID=1044 RepID=A0A074N180_ERYLO|nr:hypothetical protein EH31_02935 [Erythrobacter longus]